MTTEETVAKETAAVEEKATKKRPAKRASPATAVEEVAEVSNLQVAYAKVEAPTMTVGQIVDAIKGITVLELSELVKALESTFGISAAAPVAVAPAPGAAPAAPPIEEQTEFTVTLKDIGANKISVIKAVREVTALGLKEAKELVESAPKTVKEGITKAEAAAIKEKLETAGATVEVK